MYVYRERFYRHAIDEDRIRLRPARCARGPEGVGALGRRPAVSLAVVLVRDRHGGQLGHVEVEEHEVQLLERRDHRR